MKDSILMAIESLCDDIATNENAEENKKRAEAITALAFSGMFIPDDEPEESDTAAEPEPVNKSSKVPASGTEFEYNGIKFVALGEEQGGLLAVVAELLEDELPFDKDNCNDWRKSSLRKYLNEEYIKNFNRADLLPLISDLTTDSGQTDYGTSEDYIALLSCDLKRKYNAVLPSYNNWWWTLTPWHIFPSDASTARLVDTDGTVYNDGACGSIGVAPACLFNLKIFE